MGAVAVETFFEILTIGGIGGSLLVLFAACFVSR
jgi:hypothetical protein